MTTANRRIAAYLPAAIDQDFIAFKVQRNIKSDSKAIAQIMINYFSGDKMNAIVKHESTSIVRSVEDLQNVSAVLAKSGFFQDCTQAAQACVKVMAGHEMGIPPFAAMTGIHIIKGKPAIGANLMAAKIKASGKYRYKSIEHTDQICKLEFLERIDNAWESIGFSEVTIDEIKSKNLDKEWDKHSNQWKEKHNWKAYPKNMLFARAISNGVRWYCSDIFIGANVYTPEELGANTDEDGNVFYDVEAQVVEPQSTINPNQKAIASVAELIGTEIQTIKTIIKSTGCNSSAELDDAQLRAVIHQMLVAWAIGQNVFDTPIQATNSLLKLCREQPDLETFVDLTNAWIAKVEGKKPKMQTLETVEV